jgi:arginyl-tRNA synthetase
MGGVLLILGTIGFYSVTSYVKNDVQEVKSQAVDQSTPVVADAASSTVEIATTTATSTQMSGKKIPFKDFLTKGGSYKCEVNQSVSTMTAKGTVYMNEGNIRLEMSSTLSGQTINTTMIARDGYMYSWTDIAAKKGFKTKMVTSGSETSTTTKVYTWDGGQIGDYSCEDWKADVTLFDVPKGITFVTQ